MPAPHHSAEIKRLSVSVEVRRNGPGRAILQRLCDVAKVMGFKRLILETTETWKEVIAFYLNFGFHFTYHQNGDVYFVFEL